MFEFVSEHAVTVFGAYIALVALALRFNHRAATLSRTDAERDAEYDQQYRELNGLK
jgi:hypothetical protein